MWFFFENLWELDSWELAIGSESGRSAETKEPVCSNDTEKRNLLFPYLVHSVVEGGGILLMLSNALLFDDLLACLWSKDAEVLGGGRQRNNPGWFIPLEMGEVRGLQEYSVPKPSKDFWFCGIVQVVTSLECIISWLSVLYVLNGRKVPIWILIRYEKVKI